MAQQLNNSVARAFDILRLLGRGRPRLSVADVTRELGLNAITAHRFLKTLEAEGALVQDRKGSYRLGYALVDLGDRARDEVHVFHHILDRRVSCACPAARVDDDVAPFVVRGLGRGGQGGSEGEGEGEGARHPSQYDRIHSRRSIAPRGSRRWHPCVEASKLPALWTPRNWISSSRQS